MFLRNAWYVAAWSHECTQSILSRTLLGKKTALFRDVNGVAHALEDRCPHRGVPLSCGKIIDGNIQCGYHGMTFNGEGHCISIPTSDRIPKAAHVTHYPLVEQDGLLWIWMGDPELSDVRPGPPRWEAHDPESGWPHKTATFQIRCDHQLMIDNLMDLTHLPFVHGKTIGTNPPSEHVKVDMEITETPRGVHFVRWLKNSTPPATYTNLVPLEDKVNRWMDFEFVAPGAVLQYSGAVDAKHEDPELARESGGFHLKIFHGITPETTDSCFYFWSAAHGFRKEEPEVTERLFSEVKSTFLEDVEFLERQWSNIREEPNRMLLSLPSDRARVLSTRFLERLTKAELETQRPNQGDQA